MKDGNRADRLKLDIVLLLSSETVGRNFEVISAHCSGCTLSWLLKLLLQIDPASMFVFVVGKAMPRVSQLA